jgi:integrase
VTGLLAAVPKIRKPKRAKLLRKPKGRAPTEEEFQRILAAVPEVVGAERAPSWQHLINGLWWSGLRLGEALELYWDRDDKLCIDLTQGRPLLRIPAELEKGHQDRLLPIAPEFAEFLLKTPAEERTGRVFKPAPERTGKVDLTIVRVIKMMTWIGEKSGVVVHVDPKTTRKKYASAHDFRRAFGDRWALRVMPPVLMQLMRHESIETTMRFYVGRSVQATADVVWEAYERAKDQPRKESSPERDTLRDTDDSDANQANQGNDASPDSAA